MLLYQSHLLGKARREAPADAQVASHRLLARAGYIDQLASGIFSLLPLGFRIHRNIAQIIREEMITIGGQELLLPALHPSTLWAESGRLTTMDPPLFRTIDRHNRELVLASTHEEVISDLARHFIESYKDLPLAVFQIQTKFRNELRPTGGLLRVREFVMKDLYSFHRSEQDLTSFYYQVQKAYQIIAQRCGLQAYFVEAESGPIGGSVSHELSIPAEAGQDTIALCPSCGFGRNVAVAKTSTACPRCGTAQELKKSIEVGHTFQLGTKYSATMGALYSEEDGRRIPILMGCYGIGVGRLMAAIAEAHHDEHGLRWPVAVAPFEYHVLALQPTVFQQALEIAQKLAVTHEVLIDDRNISAGEKLVESDLLGIPTHVIVSEKNQKDNRVEIVDRHSKKTQRITVSQLFAEAIAKHAS